MKKNNKKQFLSLIIPSYKQEKTIIKDLKKILKVIKNLPYKSEIIVIIDGYIDRTKEKIKKAHLRKVRCIGYKHNHGKGYAVRYGMAHAKGDIIAFLDAGMDLSPEGLEALLDIFILDNADIVIGSKLHPNSEVTYPIQRKILSWGYRTFVKVFFGLSIKDTQVGLKVYKRKVLEKVLPRLLVKRYAFDIEILAVSHYLGFTRIYEAPIKLSFNSWSSITSRNFWSVVFRMMWDTLAVYYRLRILNYYNDNSKRKWQYDPELNFRINIG